MTIGNLSGLPTEEFRILQEMFDIMSERLSDDLKEVYVHEFGLNTGKPLPDTEILKRWMADLYALKSLSRKYDVDFDFEKIVNDGLNYMVRQRQK